MLPHPYFFFYYFDYYSLLFYRTFFLLFSKRIYDIVVVLFFYIYFLRVLSSSLNKKKFHLLFLTSPSPSPHTKQETKFYLKCNITFSKVCYSFSYFICFILLVFFMILFPIFQENFCLLKMYFFWEKSIKKRKRVEVIEVFGCLPNG